ncbi:hypothetical protein GCM10020220_014110 [Nonomuraea rubra]|uniref:hypothetical protein n=1 Tax=Nonomuraea rubra TaxID=46180 RepID=UPI0031E6DB98
MIRARRATQVTAGLAAYAGVRLVRARALPVPGEPAVLIDGEVHRADRVVWACGAWAAQLFDGLPITVTKQDTLHFAVPAALVGPGDPGLGRLRRLRLRARRRGRVWA